MRRILAAILIVLGTHGGAWAQATYKLRASLDTSATHARTIAVTDFLKQLQDRSGGRIQTELGSVKNLGQPACPWRADRPG